MPAGATRPCPRSADNRFVNYRHSFHAGNFADVMKHALLVRILVHLKAKPTPFRVIDTHAGAGLYDLSDETASRTLEWQGGIGRLLDDPPEGEAGALLAPYLDIVRVARKTAPNAYPGSPAIVQKLLRLDDRLIAFEAHPPTVAALRTALGRDTRIKPIALDGWTGLNANIPPKERRGLVLIDPPFEARDEFDTLAASLISAWRKWPGGIYAAWYPVKDAAQVQTFMAGVQSSGIAPILRTELRVAPRLQSGLAACGLLVVNPPFTLAAEAAILLPDLARIMARNDDAGWRCDWLVPERLA